MQNVRVGDVEFNGRTGELVRGEEVTRLRPHAAEAFSLLIEHAGELVSRQQLCDRIWPRGGVELDLGLNVCIRQIRVALDDDAEAPRYIETLRARGYRLIAPVQQPQKTAPEPAPPVSAVSPPTLPARPSRWVLVLVAALMVVASGLWLRTTTQPAPLRIAVLPFDAEDLPDSIAFLGSELAVELITSLATLNEERLAVIAKTSSFQAAASGATPRALGATLGADYLVAGSLEASGSQYLMSVHLIDVSSDTYAWSERYVVSRAALLALDQTLTAEVLTAMNLPVEALAANEPSRVMSADARMALLGAGFLLDQFTRASAERALTLLDRALTVDSTLGPLWVERSRAHLTLGEFEEAQHAIDRARGLDGYVAGLDHAEARLALYGLGDSERAVDLLSRAIALEPGVAEVRHTYAQALAAVGELAEAAAQGATALELDPVSATVRGDVGWIFYYARDFSTARTVCRSMLDLRPASASAGACVVLASYFDSQLPSEANTARDLVLQLGGTEAEGDVVRQALGVGDIEPLASWLNERGLALGLDVITRARALALLGEQEGAADLLLRAAADPHAQLTSVLNDPLFDAIREQPSYLRFLEVLDAT